ncbi:ATP-binding protein [Streptomyces sp. NPDC060028]|uniref:ATP-binding protein n=1 Tax=Streptomyces sp. NPDC060028 TaxID=3347041 RepID=UPI0036C9E4BB
MYTTAVTHPASPMAALTGAVDPVGPVSPVGRVGPVVTPAPAAEAPPRGFARWTAEPTAATVPLLRARVRALLEGWEVAADTADVLLLAVSELVANVVLHAAAAPGRMRVSARLGGGWLQLEVADRAPGLPRLPDPAAEVDPDDEHGRGLLIVQLLAAEAGGRLTVTADRFGTAVRVRVPAA